MNILNTIRRGMTPDEMKEILDKSTIFDKIEFSNITKDAIREKINHIETVQIPNRTVLLDMDESKLAECWFKNWLHPMLKNAVPMSPTSKAGCSKKVLQMDFEQDAVHFYENGQGNFKYTLDDIKVWLKTK